MAIVPQSMDAERIENSPSNQTGPNQPDRRSRVAIHAVFLRHRGGKPVLARQINPLAVSGTSK